MDRLEILIDNLLIYLPPDIPFLAILMQRPEGRYIVFGLAIVTALFIVWLLLAVLQMMFFGQQTQQAADKTPPKELSDQPETAKVTETETETETADGLAKKFRMKSQTDEDPALVAIEQEMLAVRRLFTRPRDQRCICE